MKRNFKANSLEQERVDRRELAYVQGGGDGYCGCACAGGYMSENAIDNGAENAEVGLKDGTDFVCIQPGFIVDGAAGMKP